MRLIDADKLYPDCMTKDGKLAISQSQLANAPTVEARLKGEWKLVERDNQDIDVVCPFCNRTRFPAYSHGYTIEELEEYLIRQHLPSFCEYCGADMRGE